MGSSTRLPVLTLSLLALPPTLFVFLFLDFAIASTLQVRGSLCEEERESDDRALLGDKGVRGIIDCLWLNPFDHCT